MNTITLEFKPVKVKVPTKDLTLEVLEEMIFDIRQEIAKTAFVRVLKKYDEVLRKQRPRGKLKNIRPKTKYGQTMVGDIQYSRTLYKEKAAKKTRYLLDEALNIDTNQQTSLKMFQLLGSLASASPYRKVQNSLSRLLGVNYSHEAIRQNVIREGKRIKEKEAKEHKKIKGLDYQLPDDLPEVVYNETDATYIRKQNKGTKIAYKQRHLEVKLGIGYTGKEPRYKGGKRRSKGLKQRIVYADIKANRNEFLDKFSCLSEKVFGTSLAKKSYLGGDGDSWIREGKKEYFGSSEYLLCPFHLFRNGRRALPGKKKIHKRLRKLFEKNKIDEILNRLRRMLNLIRSYKLKKKILKFYTYVQDNREGIEASMRIRIDKSIERAKAVEPNIDKVIAHRFKGRGMSWSEDGAQSLLKIRQTIINGQWENWWYKERDKKIEIKAIFKKTLTAADMNKKHKIAPFIEAELPCYHGQDQGKPCVGVGHELTRVRQFS